MLKIVVCEDNQKILENYQTIFERVIRDHGMSAQITLLASSFEQVEKFLRNGGKADFYLFDIDLKSSRTGVDLAYLVREKSKSAYIVFVSAYLQYVFLSFKVRAFDFLPKPVNFEVLEKLLCNIYDDYIGGNSDNKVSFIEVKGSGFSRRIKKEDIIFVERLVSKCIIHTTAAQISCNHTLIEISNSLSDPRFLRCHKSFICNKEYIEEFRGAKNEILLSNGLSLPIGRKYRNDFLNELKGWGVK